MTAYTKWKMPQNNILLFSHGIYFCLVDRDVLRGAINISNSFFGFLFSVFGGNPRRKVPAHRAIISPAESTERAIKSELIKLFNYLKYLQVERVTDPMLCEK